MREEAYVMTPKPYTTKGRTKITELLKNHPDQVLTANDILAMLEQETIDINLSTVYRYLNKLSEEGIVMKHIAPKGEKAAFQYIGEVNHCHNHLHLQCRNCGRVIHLDCEFMQQIYGHILNEHNFKLECGNSVLLGLCDQCREE